jgi:hypothetical protein
MIGRNSRKPARESAFWQAYSRSRYTILFYALLFTLLVTAIATTIGLPAIMIKLLVGGSLFAAIMPNATRRSRQLLFGATFVLVLARIASAQGYVPVNSAFVLGIVALAGLLAAAGALRFTVTSNVVNRETIYAALSTYLLAGFFFGQLYGAIEGLYPGSLVGPDPVSETAAIYYSFITLATLGYGDFLPRTDIMRGLATFEVIGGQLFLAVMVARLVGAFGSKDAET